MNVYVSIMSDVIDYIEQRISDKLSLAELSAHAKISDFHFNRIFKTVVGVTLKQYILSRKLSCAAALLANTSRSVIDIAMDFGFDYPEVFSRAFKSQLGVSPAAYRNHPESCTLTPKASVVERDIINYRGTLALKGEVEFIEPLLLCGVFSDVNENSPNFKQELKNVNEGFLLKSADESEFLKDRFFTSVTCSGNDDGGYRVFCGREPVPETELTYDSLLVPGGCYANFTYHGDMFDIREVFIDDLYKWIMVKEIKLAANGIGMLNIYPGDYPHNSCVRMLVPIQQP